MKRAHTLHGFDLNRRDNWFRVPLERVTPGDGGVVVGATLKTGTWATGTLTVKYYSGGAGPFDFPTAKSIAAGGGVVRVSAAELEGVDELEVRLSDVAGGTASADIGVTIDER